MVNLSWKFDIQFHYRLAMIISLRSQIATCSFPKSDQHIILRQELEPLLKSTRMVDIVSICNSEKTSMKRGRGIM